MSAELVGPIVDQYLEVFPDERPGLAALLSQLAAGSDLNNRKTYPGHVTGSAFVISPDRQRILLVKHTFLGRWLQPGGHWDPGEPDPLAAARRETYEETGVSIAFNVSLIADAPLVPLDIEIQSIPARPEKQESKHLHYDFRYAFVADSEELDFQEAEVGAADWFKFDQAEGVGVSRAISKLRIAGFIEA